MSDRVERVTGLPPSGYIGQSRIVMFGDPEGDYFLQQHVADLQARRPFADFVQWINRPRGMVCISTSGKPRYDGQGRFIGYIGVGRDVTEEQRSEEHTSELQSLMRNSYSV